MATLAVALLLIHIPGCAKAPNRFEILSFKDQSEQNLYAEHFPDGSFAVNAHKDTTIVFSIAPEQLNRSLAEPPRADLESQAQPEQIVRVHVFWKPRPGTSYADSTQTDADIAYCLITGRNSISYEGAGFVYFTRSKDGKSMTGQIESSILVPAHVIGQPNDLFGPCHVKGHFTAREDRKTVVEVEQRLQRYATSRPAQ